MRRSYQVIFKIPYPRFLNSSTVDILDWLICVVGWGFCPMHCRLLNSIPTTCLLDTRSTPHAPQYDNRNTSLDIAKCPQKGKIPAGWEPLLYSLIPWQMSYCQVADFLNFFHFFFSDSPISLLSIVMQFLISIIHSPSSAFP